MKQKILLVSIALLLASAGQAKIWYVKEGGAGAKNGNSWADASDLLQAIINGAVANDTIYVAAGTYKPDRSLAGTVGSNRDNAFYFTKVLKVFGGFPTTGSPGWATRDWGLYPTILSGERGVAGDATDNCYHVVVTGNVSNAFQLDGFIITEGYANGSNNNTLGAYPISRGKGGGWHNAVGSPSVSNVRIINNSSVGTLGEGGGFFNSNGSPVLVNVVISGNAAQTGGGWCNFKNTGLPNSAAINPVLTNVTISGNKSVGTGGGWYNQAGNPVLKNSIIYNNSAATTPGLHKADGTPAISYSLIQGDAGGTNGNLNGNTVNPLFTNPALPSAAPTAAGDYSLSGCSPVINQGLNSSVTGISKDLANNARIADGTVDLGAYEYPGPRLVITNTINTAICVYDSILFNNVWRRTAGQYTTDTLLSPSGCDSVAILNLTVNPYQTVTRDTTVCSSTGFTYKTVLYTTSQTIRDTFSTTGCDSIVTINLTVNTLKTATFSGISSSICYGSTAPVLPLTSSNGVTGTWVPSTVSNTATGSYTFTPTPGQCAEGATITITVGPALSASAMPAAQTICSGAATSIALNSGVTGATYAWTVVQSGVTGAANGSGANIAQTLTRSGTTAGTATYTITPSANGCTGSPITVVVTVNPKPAVTATPSAQTICSGVATSIALSSGVSGTTYNWTVVQSGVTGSANGSGANIAQTLTNIGTIAGTATYTVTPAANSCSGTPVAVVVTVNPKPAATATPSTQAICSGGTTSIALSSGVSGTTYNWIVVQSGVTGASAGSGANIAHTLTNSGSAAGTATYTVTPTATTCSGTPVAVVVTVNPKPSVTITPSNPADICAGDSVLLSATTGSGYTYQWKEGTSVVGSNTSMYAAKSTGLYRVVTTGIGDCKDSSAVVNVSVYSRPIVSLLPGDTSFCAGGVVALTVETQDTGLIYRWKNGSVVMPQVVIASFDADETGIYSVVAGRSHVPGCKDSTNDVHVTVHPLPVADITWDGSLLHTTPGLTGYQWYTGTQGIPGETDSIFRPLIEGAYHVVVTDSNGCTNVSVVKNVTPVGVIHHLGLDAQVKVYPNPSRGIVYVATPVPVNVILSSMEGKMLQIIENAGAIPLDDYASGIYLLRITDMEGTLIRNERIVKER